MQSVRSPHLPRHARRLVLVAVAALAVGCGGGDVGGTDDQDAAPTTGEDPAVTASAVPTSVLDEVRNRAADRTGVQPAELEVVRAEDARWASSALGCPEDGQMYTQVVTEGSWVVVRAGDEELDYRAADDGTIRLCESGGEPPMEP